MARASRKYAGDESAEADISLAHEQARGELILMRDTLEPLIVSLWKHLSLLSECPGARGWSFRGVEQAQVDVAEWANRLRAPMSEIYQGITASTLTEPKKHEVLGDAFGSVRWLLDDGEDLIWLGKPFLSRRVVIATTTRVLVLKSKHFRRTGKVDSEYLLKKCSIATKTTTNAWEVKFWKSASFKKGPPDDFFILYRMDYPNARFQKLIDSLEASCLQKDERDSIPSSTLKGCSGE